MPSDTFATPLPEFTPVDSGPDDPALMIYTSGTTGNAKGALHGHRVMLGHLPGAEMPHEFLPQPGPSTAMGWNIAPDGLTDLLVSLSEQFPDQPLMVTENGAAFDDVVGPDGTIDDTERTDYLRRHFLAARDALDRGVDLRGYFVWSLLDNFEWSFGYSKRFGIVRVNFDTLHRTLKASAHWYRRLIASRSVTVADEGWR